MSSSPNLSFNCAIITGGAGGLGKAMAKYFLALDKKVILVGRTESKLKATVNELGNKTPYYVLDTGDIDAIPTFVRTVIKEYPEVDCLVNNAGVQRPLKIQSFDLDKADEEININIRGPMHLTIGLLDHFKANPRGGLVISVTSVLGFCPWSIINPVYGGTKAWLHFWTMNLRTQLKGTKVRVVEIVPPSVGTDLHREREDPDDNRKDKNPTALTVEEYMTEVRTAMEQGNDIISAGSGNVIVGRWYEAFGDQYAKSDAEWK